MDNISPQQNSKFQEQIRKRQMQILQCSLSEQNLQQQNQNNQISHIKNQSQKSSQNQDSKDQSMKNTLKYKQQNQQTLKLIPSLYKKLNQQQKYNKNEEWKQQQKDGGQFEHKKQGIYPDPYQDLNDEYHLEEEDQDASIQNGQNISSQSKQNELGIQNIYGFHDVQPNEQDRSGDKERQQYLHQYYLQNQNHSNFIQKNSDGRHLSERQKRNFIKGLMDKIKNADKSVAHQIISKQSEKIKVFSNEVTIWLSIYKIVFAVEFERSKNRLTQQGAIYQVESRLVDYLNQNPYEKKYKFIKISNRTFRSLKIKKCTGDYWLHAVFKKFANKISPLIDQAALLKKQNQKHSTLPLYNQPFSSDIMYEPAFSNKHQADFGHLEHPRQHIDLMCNNNFPNQRSERYSIQYRMKIVESIDNSIERALSNIFYDKHNQYKLNLNSLKSWYINYGKLDLFDEGSVSHYHQQMSAHRERAKSLGNSFDTSNANNIKTAQKEVLNYIKVNAINSRQKIRSFALITVARLKIEQLKYEKAFKNWLDRLLLNNCTDINGTIRLKETHINIAIPNISQPLTIFKNKAFKQEAKRQTIKNFEWTD